MGQFFSKNKRWICYVVYCILLAGIFLYFRFPSEQAKHYIQYRVNRMKSPLSLSVQEVRPCLPWGLKLENAGFSLKQEPGTRVFTTDSLCIDLIPWSFLKGKAGYAFECLACGGDIKGNMSFGDDEEGSSFFTEMEIRNLHVEALHYLKDLTGREVEGMLSGTVSYGAKKGSNKGATGEADVSLRRGNLEASIPFLNLESIKFDNIDMKMALGHGRITLQHFKLNSPLLVSTLSGTIELKENIQESRLDLKGSLKPFASFFRENEFPGKTLSLFKRRFEKGTANFIIRGMLGEPRVRLT